MPYIAHGYDVELDNGFEPHLRIARAASEREAIQIAAALNLAQPPLPKPVYTVEAVLARPFTIGDVEHAASWRLLRDDLPIAAFADEADAKRTASLFNEPTGSRFQARTKLSTGQVVCGPWREARPEAEVDAKGQQDRYGTITRVYLQPLGKEYPVSEYSNWPVEPTHA